MIVCSEQGRFFFGKSEQGRLLNQSSTTTLISKCNSSSLSLPDVARGA